MLLKMRSSNIKWVIFFFGVIILCLIWIIIITGGKSTAAVIYLNDKEIKRIDNLYPETTEYEVIETDGGYNKIAWFNGEIWVEEADCENQTCVHFGKLSSSGLSIICAPHGLTIIIEDGDRTVDAIT